MDIPELPIGVLVFGDVALCLECTSELGLVGALLYAGNILPYRQTCAYCGYVIIVPSVPELFTGKLPKDLLPQ